MNLEQQFRNGLAGQLSDDKTDVDVRVAAKIAREFAVEFTFWKDKDCFEIFDSGLWYVRDNEEYNNAYTIEQLLKIYEDEVYCK